jgi:hypothetical protein
MATLIIMVLDDVGKLQDVMDTWRKAGSCGITILESSGAGRLARMGARDDLPLFPGLQSILSHQETHHRTLFTVVGDDVDLKAFFDATEAVVGSFSDPGTGIIVALPVLDVRGDKKKGGPY